MGRRIQGLWNRVLDECAEKQKKGSNSNETSRAPSGVVSAGDDSRGETSEESHGEGSSSAESEMAEPEAATRELGQLGVHDTGNVTSTGAEHGDAGPSQVSNASPGKGKADGAVDRTASDRRAQEAGSTAGNPVSLGRVLEETAREHLASFSTEEMEVWNWHRGNLEISCGAVSVTQKLSSLTMIRLTAHTSRS